MAKRKYVMSKGLAFAEDQDMRMLSKKAKKGWHLKDFAFAGYSLEKGEPADLQYSIDYRKLEPGESEEYFEMFSYGGWEHVCSQYDMHIFKAKPGRAPIYSDAASSVEKVNRLAVPIHSITIFILASTLAAYGAMVFTTGTAYQISKWLLTASIVCLFPSVMMVVAVHFRKWRKESGR